MIAANKRRPNRNDPVLKDEYYLQPGSWASSTVDEVVKPVFLRVVEQGDDCSDWTGRDARFDGILRKEIKKKRCKNSDRVKLTYAPYRHPFYKLDYEDSTSEYTYIG